MVFPWGMMSLRSACRTLALQLVRTDFDGRTIDTDAQLLTEATLAILGHDGVEALWRMGGKRALRIYVRETFLLGVHLDSEFEER